MLMCAGWSAQANWVMNEMAPPDTNAALELWLREHGFVIYDGPYMAYFVDAAKREYVVYDTLCTGGIKEQGEKPPRLTDTPEEAIDGWKDAFLDYAVGLGKHLYWRRRPVLEQDDDGRWNVYSRLALLADPPTPIRHGAARRHIRGAGMIARLLVLVGALATGAALVEPGPTLLWIPGAAAVLIGVARIMDEDRR